MPPTAPRPLPQWLVILGSLFVVGHLGAVVFLVLGAQSGPWPTPYGESNADGPYFAQKIGSFLSDNYLRHLRMTHNYHFVSNRTDEEYVAFDVILRDAKGVEIKKVSIPDPDANFWVRHRQKILARNLVPDVPVAPAGAEKLAAPGKKLQKIPFWEPVEEKKEGLPLPNQPSTTKLVIRRELEHLIPRDRPVSKVSDWSMVVAEEYQRFLCEKYDAAKSDLIRYYRQPVLPEYLAIRQAPNAFPEIISYFEEYRAPQR
jgi:hypothetical protein